VTAAARTTSLNPRPVPRPVETGHPAQALLARETRTRRGPVPRELGGVAVGEDAWFLHGDSFVLRAADGIGFHYRRGEGVCVEQPAGADPRDVRLWLNGSVYAAVAAINGLMPLHASAVACEGRVYAFTGPPGAGKSTLAAALGREGLPLFCDDTLVLDLSGEGALTCLPGHKRLKLWPEGLALSGAAAQEQVGSDYPKHFAEPAGGTWRQPLPLAELIFLERGEDVQIVPVSAGERIARLQDDHYTAALFEQASALPRPQRFAQLAAIAARMPMRRFARPFEPARFGDGLAAIVRHVRAGAAA
jgi:hypothetical protein